MSAPSPARRLAGGALSVLSVLAFLAAAVNLVGHLLDLEDLQLPGAGLAYILVGLAASAGATALLKGDST